jgi:hypothetical protein
VRELQSLRRYLHIQLGYARGVAARSGQAGDEADLHRIGGVVKSMGIVVAAALTAITAGVLRRSQPRDDASASAAIAGTRSYCPSA